jgi:hypothetical protein
VGVPVLLFDLIQNIIDIGQKMKSSAKNSETTAIRILCNATTSLNTTSLTNTIKGLAEKNPSSVDKIKVYEEKLHALPGFDAPIEIICLVISRLLIIFMNNCGFFRSHR